MTLLAAYNFDGTGTAAVDQTGNGNDFDLTDTAANRGAGHTAGGLSTTSGVSYPTRTPFAQTSLRTIMCWYKAPTVPPAGYCIDWHVPAVDSSAWGILFLSGDVQLRARSDTTLINPLAPAPVDGVWHHYAGTYDGTTARLYLDGTQVASDTLTGPIRTDTDVIRMLEGAPADNFIDDLRVYDEALDQTTIAALMATPVPSPPAAATVAAVPAVLDLAAPLPIVQGIDSSVQPATITALPAILDLAIPSPAARASSVLQGQPPTLTITAPAPTVTTTPAVPVDPALILNLPIAVTALPDLATITALPDLDTTTSIGG